MIESAVIMLVIFVLTAWAYYQDVIVGKLEFRRSRAYFGLIAAVVSYPLLTLALRYFDSIPGSWDNDTVKILVLAMAALLVIGVVLVLVHREVERKRATLLQVSRRLGFSYDPEGSSPLSRAYVRCPLWNPFNESLMCLEVKSRCMNP